MALAFPSSRRRPGGRWRLTHSACDVELPTRMRCRPPGPREPSCARSRSSGRTSPRSAAAPGWPPRSPERRSRWCPPTKLARLPARCGSPTRSAGSSSAPGGRGHPGHRPASRDHDPSTDANGRDRCPAGILRAMRLSQLFFTTLRDDPSDAEMPSHRLLLRAGYLRQLGSGIYSLLPLGKRVSDRVEQVIREEIERDRRAGDGDARRPPRGGVEGERAVREDRARAGPVQGPRRAGHGPGDDPRGGRRDPAARHRPELPPAADDRVPLPDEVPRRAPLPGRPHPRPRVRDEGLLLLRRRRRRARRRATSKHYAAYEKIFRRLGLDAIPVRSDVGIMGGSGAHEFMVVNDFGEDTLVLCDNVRLRRQPADRGRRQARSGARGPPADGGRRDAGHDDDRGARRPSSASRSRRRPRRRSS